MQPYALRVDRKAGRIDFLDVLDIRHAGQLDGSGWQALDESKAVALNAQSFALGKQEVV